MHGHVISNAKFNMLCRSIEKSALLSNFFVVECIASRKMDSLNLGKYKYNFNKTFHMGYISCLYEFLILAYSSVQINWLTCIF